MKRKLALFIGLSYLAVLHVVVVMAFFTPHFLPDQSWRLNFPPPEPTAYVAQRHRSIQWLDAHAEEGSVALLGASHLEMMDPALFDSPVLNYAAGTDTLRNMGKRTADYPNLASASAIILWGGYNDIAHRSAVEIGADLPRVLAGLPAGVPVVLVSVAPSNYSKKQEETAAINRTYANICDQEPRCTFVDITRLLIGQDGGLSKTYDRGDGVHLNRAGYRLVAQALASALPPE